MNHQSAFGRGSRCVASMMFFALALGIPASASARKNGFVGATPASCRGCHEGRQGPSIEVKFSKENINPGETVTVDVTIKATDPKAYQTGIWFDAQDVGKLTLVDTDGTRLHNDTQALHSKPKRIVDNKATYQFKWTAPNETGISVFRVSSITSLPPDGDKDLHGLYSSPQILPSYASIAHGCNATWYYSDEDKDGFGGGDSVSGSAELSCTPVAGKITKGGDCDDTKAEDYPGAEEKCDGRDNNCDGEEDEGLEPGLYYKDNDGDGFASRTAVADSTCKDVAASKGLVSKRGDCNDSKSEINPDAKELCDGIDNNCNSKVDDDCSNDGEGGSGGGGGRGAGGSNGSDPGSDSGGCSFGSGWASTPLPLGVGLIFGITVAARLLRRRKR